MFFQFYNPYLLSGRTLIELRSFYEIIFLYLLITQKYAMVLLQRF